MFRPGVILAFIGVAAVHGALLLLLQGQNSAPVKEVKKQVIQGVLLAASAPVPKVPEERKPNPNEKRFQKSAIKENIVQQELDAPLEKVVEKHMEEPPEEIAELIEEEVAQQIVEEIPEQSPQPPADSEDEPLAASPPRIDDAGHLNNPLPSYPRLSKRLREEGEVILELWVLEDGTVSGVEIKTSSGYPRLDKAALNAVKKWRYTPASRNGEAMAHRYRQPVQFSMK